MAEKLTDDEIKNIVSQEVKSSIGYLDSEVSAERRKALDYYLGEPFGDEQPGRSSVVSRDVMDTVEWMLPGLLRMFASSDDTVEFEPQGPEDEPFARQATDYANHIFNNDNDGFTILYVWLKDALLSKVGVVKHYWEEIEEWSAPEIVTGLDDAAFNLLVAEEDLDVLEHSAEVDFDEMGVEQITHALKFRRLRTSGRVRVCNIPPEEFLISTDARNDIDGARFVGHRRAMTVSDLLELGFDRDLVEKLPTAYGDYSDIEAEERKDDIWGGQDPETLDKSQREVWVTEAYVKMDIDGDGISELVKVWLGGDAEAELLDWEEVDRVPFSAWTPILVPHRFHGLSVADLVMDVQRIKSTLLRQTLDNLYLSNNPRKIVLEGAANLDDVLNSVPGGVIRVKRPDAVSNDALPFTAGESYGMLEYLDGLSEKRTGLSGASGLDPNVLQNATAAAVSAAMSAAQQRMELIARVFAETGLRHLFRNILRIIVQHQDKERVIRLRNEWVPMDPRGWNADMDVSVNVGLGNGNREGQIAALQQIAAKQEQILLQLGPNNPLVSLGQYRATLAKMTEQAGFKNTEAFWKDIPEDYQPPQQGEQVDPEVLKAQAEMQQDAAKMQAEMQMRAAEMEQRMQLDREKAERDAALAREKIAQEAETARTRLAAEMDQARTKLAAEMQLQREKMALNAQTTDSGMGGDVRFGGEVG